MKISSKCDSCVDIEWSIDRMREECHTQSERERELLTSSCAKENNTLRFDTSLRS